MIPRRSFFNFYHWFVDFDKGEGCIECPLITCDVQVTGFGLGGGVSSVLGGRGGV